MLSVEETQAQNNVSQKYDKVRKPTEASPAKESPVMNHTNGHTNSSDSHEVNSHLCN